VSNTVALTFDDGPYNYIREVDDILKRNGANGTFFFNGNNWGCIYSTANAANVKFVYDRGHQVASHTWAHKDLTTLSWDNIHDEMWKVELALQRITGATPAFMRPPYGNYNNLVLDASGVRGQSVITWDFDAGDSRGVSVAAQKTAWTNLANRRPSTILSLAHETNAQSVREVLPHAIAQLRAKGYRMVTVAQCLGRAPYQSVGAPQARTSAWRC
jgi:peptidoglycan/xylan/chitin deacetylase (PgdA/CDA1 family)